MSIPCTVFSGVQWTQFVPAKAADFVQMVLGREAGGLGVSLQTWIVGVEREVGVQQGGFEQHSELLRQPEPIKLLRNGGVKIRYEGCMPGRQAGRRSCRAQSRQEGGLSHEHCAMFGFQTVSQSLDFRILCPGLDRPRRRDKIQVVIASADEIPLGSVRVCDLWGFDYGLFFPRRNGVDGFNDRFPPVAGRDARNGANQQHL